MKQKIKKIFPILYNYYIKNKQNVIIKNYYKTKFSKCVLISYLSYPLIKGIKLSHTNSAECIKITETFRKIGFNCDIVDNQADIRIDYHKYDVVFGFGKVFENSFYSNRKIFKIYYGTGKHPYFSNMETIKRGLNVMEKKNEFLLESLRLIKEDYSLQTTASDTLLIIGGETDSSTYRKYTNNQINTINVSFFKIHDYLKIINEKNFLEAGKHFLFFSGSGLIHKGLDLLLEAFSRQNDLYLHICADIKSEPKFENIYKDELYKTKNIHTYGFVNINSETFKKLITKCAFVILPSCSEAMPTSVVNVIGNGGLIPILPSASSINIDELTLPITDLTVESVVKSLKETQTMTNDKKKKISLKIGEFINNNYTIENFSKNIETILKNILYENKM